jgi:hypothetical protein
MTALFLPLSVLVGTLAGLISKKLFALVWNVVDSHDPPDPKQRVESHVKLLLALALEGALIRLLRGGLDHASRHGFARVVGVWPGEE